MKRILCLCICSIWLLCVSTVSASENEMALLQGYEAFRSEDWVSALFFFRRAVNTTSDSEETWYMLILSEMFAGEYSSAIDDCDRFVMQFPSSNYYPLVLYQRGRALYYQQQFDDSVVQLTEFCHLYPEHELYPAALFWIAESFFSEYNYSAAEALYERIVSDFPYDAKAADSQSRLRDIGQAEREEKLLYLLKVTGEEYLAAKESYEKQLRQYQADGSDGVYEQLKKRSSELEALHAELEQMLQKNIDLENQISALEEQNKLLQLSAEEARKIAVDVVNAGQQSVSVPSEVIPADTGALQSGTGTESFELGDIIKEETPVGVKNLYPELEELKRKAAELLQLIEENSAKGTQE